MGPSLQVIGGDTLLLLVDVDLPAGYTMPRSPTAAFPVVGKSKSCQVCAACSNSKNAEWGTRGPSLLRHHVYFLVFRAQINEWFV